MGPLYLYGTCKHNEPTLVTWAMTPHGPMLAGSSPLGKSHHHLAHVYRSKVTDSGVFLTL
jgi:hypothetical protein